MLRKKMIAVILSMVFIATELVATSASAINDAVKPVSHGQEELSGDAVPSPISIGNAPEFALNVDFEGFDPKEFSINGIKTVPSLNSKGNLQVHTMELVAAAAGKAALAEEKIPVEEAAIEESKLVRNDDGRLSVKNLYNLYLTLKRAFNTKAGADAVDALANASEEARALFKSMNDSLSGIAPLYASTRSNEEIKWSTETRNHCQAVIKVFLTAYDACKTSSDPYLQDIIKYLETNGDFSALLGMLYADDWSAFDEENAAIEEIQQKIKKINKNDYTGLFEGITFVCSDGANTRLLAVESVFESVQTFLCPACGYNPCVCVPLDPDPMPDPPTTPPDVEVS